VADQIAEATDSMLAKYLTIQSGYMSLILLILIPFVRTMLMSDFTAIVPMWNLIATIVILGILTIANFKDKMQEHTTAAVQLANPKVIDSAVDSFTKMSESLKKLQLEEIKQAVKDCLLEIQMEAKLKKQEAEMLADAATGINTT